MDMENGSCGMKNPLAPREDGVASYDDSYGVTCSGIASSELTWQDHGLYNGRTYFQTEDERANKNIAMACNVRAIFHLGANHPSLVDR
ncbi:hypothetical protein RRG08_029888 [Elysia crispata]|uniref:Uncharacterized protein n=1 Tax=Elysia crispata TaxID=231223 RepID=A0AAE1CZX8_9GAST|nr:hypothetical protein RRG08_029888 [Elysia crispata]